MTRMINQRWSNKLNYLSFQDNFFHQIVRQKIRKISHQAELEGKLKLIKPSQVEEDEAFGCQVKLLLLVLIN